MIQDSESNIDFLKQRVREFVEARDWDQYHHPKELAISLNLEAAELLEIFQWKEKEPIEKIINNSELINKLREELADVIIYSIEIANKTGIDITQAVLDKLKINEEKYPVDKAKGASTKYSEL